MSWFRKGDSIEKSRVQGIELGTSIIHMQFRLGGALKEFYSRSHTYYALGYCFGVYQASLEVAKSGKVTAEEYDTHIRQGFAAAFLSERMGNENFERIRGCIQQNECLSGRVDGAQEYLDIYQRKAERPYALAQFLLSGVYQPR